MEKCDLIRDLYEKPEAYIGKKIRVGGWVRTLRDQKNFAFIALNDGSHFQPLQVVFTREDFTNYDELAKIGNGSAIFAEGTLVSVNFPILYNKMAADRTVFTNHFQDATSCA